MGFRPTDDELKSLLEEVAFYKNSNEDEFFEDADFHANYIVDFF